MHSAEDKSKHYGHHLHSQLLFFHHVKLQHVSKLQAPAPVHNHNPDDHALNHYVQKAQRSTQTFLWNTWRMNANLNDKPTRLFIILFQKNFNRRGFSDITNSVMDNIFREHYLIACHYL